MSSWIDWPVLVRQMLLVVVPVLVSKNLLPDYLAGPLTDALTYIIGTVIVGAVIAYGQRREQPANKIAETAALSQVKQIEVKSEKLAQDIISSKVVS